MPERNAQEAALALRSPHRQSSKGDQEAGVEGVRERGGKVKVKVKRGRRNRG